jgi:endonuclease YncB( thermonuclease family)
MQRSRTAVALVAVVAASFAGRWLGEQRGESSQLVRVLRAIDGDTIVVRAHGQTDTVRILGVDTPGRVKHHLACNDGS